MNLFKKREADYVMVSDFIGSVNYSDKLLPEWFLQNYLNGKISITNSDKYGEYITIYSKAGKIRAFAGDGVYQINGDLRVFSNLNELSFRQKRCGFNFGLVSNFHGIVLLSCAIFATITNGNHYIYRKCNVNYKYGAASLAGHGNDLPATSVLKRKK